MSTLATYFLVALAVSVVVTPICRLAAQRLGCVAKPSADRWHRRPTALFGGVAIVVAVVGLALTIQPRGFIWHLVAAGGLIAAFGFVDDLMHLKASTKLIAQIVVASLLLFLGYRLEWTQSLIGDAMLTLFWIVGITNAFNLLDNMDGLCAGTTLVAGVFLLIGAGRGRRRVAARALPGDACSARRPVSSSTTSTRLRSSWATRAASFSASTSRR